MKIQNEDLVVDVDKTFGDLYFEGLVRTTYEYQYDADQDRNVNTGEILDQRYEVISTAQRTFFNVIVPPTVDVEFPEDTVVELVNPTFDSYYIDRNNVDIRVIAEDILKKDEKNSTVGKQESKKREIKVDNDKKEENK